jgi:hypothetical protein
LGVAGVSVRGRYGRARTVPAHADSAGVRGARACVVRARQGLIAVALFPTVHLLRDRHGLLMNTYGRELPSLNNEAGL